MRISHAVLLLLFSSTSFTGYAASHATSRSSQSPVGSVSTQIQPPTQTGPAPSEILQPSLDTLLQTLNKLRVDKWKGGSVRAEANTNIASIQRDIQDTLPPLLKVADTTPFALSSVLPISRNIGALYDVVLRVFDGARVAAPGEQVDQLQQAMTGLEKARRALDNRLEDAALAQERQITDLQATIKTQASVVCPPPPPAPVCPAPPKKPVRKRKPLTTKPSTTTPPAAQNPATKPPSQ